jgi:DNA-binding NtrC family response regulator/nitrogen-specific signal transduction histidine kinase
VNALERKKAEEMKASERLKSEFLTNITHEFRTPLTLAMGPLEEVLFGGDRTIEKPLREQLELSFRNIRKLLQLINQLLEFSRLEAGATVLNYQKSNLKDFVAAIIEFFSSLAESKKIKTVFMHHKEDYTAYIDPEKMDKVLVNVIGNAFKFTPERGTVEIRCQVVEDRSQMSEVQRHNVDTGKAHRDYIEIIVKDSGIGIKSEELGKIFERFHQANGTVSSGAGGTGIGLSLAKELLALQGGSIDVESIYGQGTTFTIRLPKGEDHIKDKNLIRRENREIEVPHCTKEYVDLIKLEQEDKEETIKGGRPLILVVDDNQDVRRYIKSILKRKYEVISANDGLEAWEKLQRFTPSLIISDIMMPKMDGYQLCQQVKSSTEFSHIPFVFLTAKTEIEMKISGLEEGADEYIVKPFSYLELMARVKSLLKNRELIRENLEKEDRIFSLTHELEGRYHYQNIVGQAKVMQKVFQIMESIKKADHPVLITGETGTGKELIAKSLHYISLRKGKPFIVQNCSAFSEHLLESEIFGHVRGAFTGAIQDKRGLFELADGGTLFLDEIGDLSSNTQAKLLRVIENGAFYPLGGVKEKKVDIRLITATNKNLKALLKEGTFREDLYYRLNVINIDLPPLRDRKEDIPLLIEYFLDDISEMYTKKKHISSQALKYLMEYSYPGNIRELRNIVEKSYLLCSGMTIRPKNLPQEIWDERKEAPTKAEPIDKMLESVQRLERQTIIEALKQTKRNKTKAAKILNISIPTLFKRIKQCKINLESI